MFEARWVRENVGLSEKGTAVMSKLISYGEVDHPFRSTALHRAIKRGDMAGAGKALASSSSSVSLCDLEGNAPIHVAVAQETLSIAMMTMLKGAGAELEQRDRVGATPLMLASLWGNLEAVQWLLRQGVHVVDPNLRDASGETALHYAVQSDKVTSAAIMKLLLEAGAHPSTRAKSSDTPLHDLRFCRGGSAMCNSKVQLLISAGAKIDSKDKFGRTALMGALFDDNSGAVGALVDAGASLKHKDQFGRTAFHFAGLYAGEKTLSELRRRRTFCSSDVDPFSLDSDGDSSWECFLWRLMTPSSKPSYLTVVTKAVCHSFEILYLQARNFTLQSRVAALQQIFALLQTKNRTRALSQLTMLVEQYESRSLWRTGVDMQPFRSIHLQLRDGDVFGALQALQEQVELLRRSMAISPWRSHSQWWDGPIYFEATPVEDCERQFAFACRMREEGLARWQRWRMRRNVGDYVYTAEASLPQRAKMLWRLLMSVRGQARGRRMRWTWTKSPYVSRRLS
jgi:ankyrin repeat protein